MKESLFQMLLNLFENSLNQSIQQDAQTHSEQPESTDKEKPVILRKASQKATRIFSDIERMQFTRTSYRFIQQVINLQLLSTENLEKILHQIEDSGLNTVTLDEIKWLVRENLLENLDVSKQTFVDMILSPNEDGPLH